jgi:hypothetical protein
MDPYGPAARGALQFPGMDIISRASTRIKRKAVPGLTELFLLSEICFVADL